MKKEKVVCIIAAGGSGTRLKSRTAKPYIVLNGKPLIIHTLGIFERTRSVDEVILAVHPAKIGLCGKLVRKYGIGKVSRIIAGGKTRQESVYNALAAAPGETAIVVIQDCARPFTGPETVEASVRAARKYGGALVGVPASDTIKRVGADGTVEGTLNRKMIWYAQTPQTFRFAEIKKCYETARKKNVEATDDAYLFELFGGRVKMVCAGSCNMKITNPEDVEIAKHVLRERKRR
jgi:2-C-methyl-D-erythritol 4-phosphate cytidylyltransferase